MPKKSLTSLLASLMLSYCMKVDMSYRVCSSACRSSPQSTNCSSTQDRFGLRGGGSGSNSLSVMGQGVGGGVSHNGDTLSDLLGMHCGRQRGSFDLGAYAHRSVPCLKTDLLFDFVLPKPSEDLYLFSGKKNLINKS